MSAFEAIGEELRKRMERQKDRDSRRVKIPHYEVKNNEKLAEWFKDQVDFTGGVLARIDALFAKRDEIKKRLDELEAELIGILLEKEVQAKTHWRKVEVMLDKLLPQHAPHSDKTLVYDKESGFISVELDKGVQ